MATKITELWWTQKAKTTPICSLACFQRHRLWLVFPIDWCPSIMLISGHSIASCRYTFSCSQLLFWQWVFKTWLCSQLSLFFLGHCRRNNSIWLWSCSCHFPRPHSSCYLTHLLMREHYLLLSHLVWHFSLDAFSLLVIFAFPELSPQTWQNYNTVHSFSPIFLRGQAWCWVFEVALEMLAGMCQLKLDGVGNPFKFILFGAL